MTQNKDYLSRIGTLVRDARQHSGLTQTQLATQLNTSQSAVNRIEKGQQNLTLETISKIGTALDSELVGLGSAGPSHLRVQGQTTLGGSIDVKSSKNAGVALLCASLLNTGTTVLRKVARIEEVNRLLEVLTSIGVSVRWLNEDNDLEIQVPETLDLGSINVEAARRTRDRKSTRLNSSHVANSYAVFCLKKKKKQDEPLLGFRLLARGRCRSLSVDGGYERPASAVAVCRP